MPTRPAQRRVFFVPLVAAGGGRGSACVRPLAHSPPSSPHRPPGRAWRTTDTRHGTGRDGQKTTTYTKTRYGTGQNGSPQGRPGGDVQGARRRVPLTSLRAFGRGKIRTFKFAKRPYSPLYLQVPSEVDVPWLLDIVPGPTGLWRRLVEAEKIYPGMQRSPCRIVCPQGPRSYDMV